VSAIAGPPRRAGLGVCVQDGPGRRLGRPADGGPDARDGSVRGRQELSGARVGLRADIRRGQDHQPG